MRLEPVDAATRDALLSGSFGGYDVAPGWPHEDSAAGLSFLEHGGWVFLIIDDDGRVAGDCGTKAPPDRDGVVEIGYGLAATSRGRGLGTAAVGALVAWLAGRRDVLAVDAEVHIANLASRRVLEHHGFAPVGAEQHGFGRYRLSLRHLQ